MGEIGKPQDTVDHNAEGAKGQLAAIGKPGDNDEIGNQDKGIEISTITIPEKGAPYFRVSQQGFACVVYLFSP